MLMRVAMLLSPRMMFAGADDIPLYSALDEINVINFTRTP